MSHCRQKRIPISNKKIADRRDTILVAGFRDFVREFAPRFGRWLGSEFPKTISDIAILACNQMLRPRTLFWVAIAYKTIHPT